MKVLHVIPAMEVGGAQKLLAEMLPALRDQGVDVSLAVYRRTRSRLERELLDRNIKIYSLNATRNWNTHIIGALRERMEECDVVHAHLRPAFYQCALAASGLKCRTVFTDYSRSHRNHRLKWLERRFYSAYDAVVTITEEGHEELVGWLGAKGDFRSRIVTIIPGIDLEKLRSTRPAPQIATNFRAVTMLARFIPSKDQKTLIRAIPLVTDPNAKFIFIGDGPTLKEHKELAEELGVADRCLFLGHRDDVPALIKASAIGVHSAISDGFGMGALKAMAAGVPVISTDVLGLTQLVGGAGLMFPVGDASALAVHINTLLNDPVQYNRIARQCVERSELYGIDMLAGDVARLYETLVATGHPGTPSRLEEAPEEAEGGESPAEA